VRADPRGHGNRHCVHHLARWGIVVIDQNGGEVSKYPHCRYSSVVNCASQTASLATRKSRHHKVYPSLSRHNHRSVALGEDTLPTMLPR
jgi:hypothetical protein